MIKEEVDSEDIADVVSSWTGIPVSKMMQSEKEKLLHLESELHTLSLIHIFIKLIYGTDNISGYCSYHITLIFIRT